MDQQLLKTYEGSVQKLEKEINGIEKQMKLFLKRVDLWMNELMI